MAKLQDGAGNPLSSFTYLQRGYTGHEHLQTVGLIHMNGRLYDPLLHRFLMPDNYVQDPSNTQNFNRYAYVLNNPLRSTDPSGELTQAQWDAARGLIRSTFVTGETPYGGYIGGDMTRPHVYTSHDEAFGWGTGYLEQFNAWGGGGGAFAATPGAAVYNYMAMGVSNGLLRFSYSNDSRSGVFLTPAFRGDRYYDKYLGETTTSPDFLLKV